MKQVMPLMIQPMLELFELMLERLDAEFRK